MKPYDRSWLAYMQLLDSALPIGGFSHSFGLETLVQQGSVSSLSDLRHYMETMLQRSWAPVDALAVKAVYLYGPEADWTSLWAIDRMQHVQRLGTETRDGVQKMGRRLMQLARALYPQLGWEPLAQAMAAGTVPGTHPTVHGWIGWRLGVPLDMAAEGYLYNCLVTCVGSALRLMSIGQTDGQKLLAELLPSIGEAWGRVASLDPFRDGYSAAPQAEIAQMRHESLYSRLFMS